MIDDFIAFVRGLYPASSIIPLHEPKFLGKEKEFVCDCIDSTFVSSVGAYVNKFEKAVANYTGAAYAISTVNGTSALHIALVVAGVKQGDEVITQPLTFVATANCISYTSAVPLFIDVDRDTLSLSPNKLLDFLIENAEIREDGTYNKGTGRRIVACVPMHTFGHPGRIEDISKICSEYKITLIEDAAESIGSRYHDKHTGLFGQMGVLSFNGNKIISTGGGGMVITSIKALAKELRHLTMQAKIDHPWEYIHDKIGYNYRLPNLNAALGCGQIENLDMLIKSKRELALQYSAFFAKHDTAFISEPAGCFSNYWLNAILLRDKIERDHFLKLTNSKNIKTRPIWKLLTHLDMYKSCQAPSIDNAEWLADRIVNIPSSPIL